MLLNGKIDDETETGSPESPSRAWAIGIGVCCLFPLYLLFKALGNEGEGSAALCFGGAIIIAARLRWELRNRIWFWVVVSIMVIAHLALVLLVPWPNRDYTLAIVLPVGVLDIFAVSFVIQLISKMFAP